MKTFRILICIGVAVAMTACSDDDEPVVLLDLLSTTPADGATDVLLDEALILEFTTDVDGLSVELEPESPLEHVENRLDNGRWIAEYRPEQHLEPFTTYQVSASSDERNPDFEWTFRTGGGVDSCEFANDGRCDEPANCELGTDATDCMEACESGENVHLFAAACEHYAPSEPTADDAVPSGGSGGETGFTDRVVTVPSGVEDVAEVQRHYRLYVPAHYDPEQPAPLVINMPGHRVGHESLPNQTQLAKSADHNDFIVAFAEQEFRDGRYAWWTDWDWMGRKDENPDFAFVEAITDAVAADYNVDLARVITSGHSRGAAMAFIAAVEMPDVVAGAVSQSGFTELGYLHTLTDPERRVPLVFIHGALDDDVCIDCRPGAECGVQPGRSCGTVHASDAVVEHLEDLGWEKEVDLLYWRLDDVAHRWQTQLNQQWWEFLDARPLPAEEVRQ